jgi:putative oxidoreductase
MKFQEQTLEVSYISVEILRILLSLIFIVACTNHFFNTDKVVSRIENANMGFIGKIIGTPYAVVILTGIVMLLAGVSLLLGFKTRVAALVLIAVLIPITLTIQVGQMSTLGPLFKNVAILGGLLFFSLNSNLKIQKQ